MNDLAPYEQAMGVPGLFTAGLYEKYGPQWAGRTMLKHLWVEQKKQPQVLRRTSFDLRDLPFGTAAFDIAWRRPLQPHWIGWYVHHYDKNSQYLSANRGMWTGIADPVHIEGDDRPRRPGIYRLSSVEINASHFNGRDYPLIIEPDQAWVTLDLLRFAEKQGYTFIVEEAWAFPEKARVLDEWAALLWQARTALKGVDPDAYNKIKMIATTSNGAWNWNKRDRPWGDKRTVFIHPNWWADTVGKARTALLANLDTYGAPVLIETDGLFYVTRNPNPRTAILSHDKGVSILARETECGGYKHKGTCQLTQALYAQCADKNPGQLAELFKEAREEGHGTF